MCIIDSDSTSDVTELLPLVISMGDERANNWLQRFIPDLDEQALFHVLSEANLDGSLRLSAAQRLCDNPGEVWDEAKGAVLTLLLDALDIERLAKVFARDDLLPLTHPYGALLVSHLAPSTIEASLRPGIYACRTKALQAIHGAEVPEVLTPVAEHLLLLKEGIYCLLYTSPSPRDATLSRMPSSA